MTILVVQSAIERLAQLLRIDTALMLRSGLSLAVIWIIAWLATLLVRLIARRIMVKVNDSDDRRISAREKRGQTIAQLLRSIGRVVIIGLALLLSLNLFI